MYFSEYCGVVNLQKYTRIKVTIMVRNVLILLLLINNNNKVKIRGFGLYRLVSQPNRLNYVRQGCRFEVGGMYITRKMACERNIVWTSG